MLPIAFISVILNVITDATSKDINLKGKFENVISNKNREELARIIQSLNEEDYERRREDLNDLFNVETNENVSEGVNARTLMELLQKNNAGKKLRGNKHLDAVRVHFISNPEVLEDFIKTIRKRESLSISSHETSASSDRRNQIYKDLIKLKTSDDIHRRLDDESYSERENEKRNNYKSFKDKNTSYKNIVDSLELHKREYHKKSYRSKTSNENDDVWPRSKNKIAKSRYETLKDTEDGRNKERDRENRDTRVIRDNIDKSNTKLKSQGSRDDWDRPKKSFKNDNDKWELGMGEKDKWRFDKKVTKRDPDWDNVGKPGWKFTNKDIWKESARTTREEWSIPKLKNQEYKRPEVPYKPRNQEYKRPELPYIPKNREYKRPERSGGSYFSFGRTPIPFVGKRGIYENE